MWLPGTRGRLNLFKFQSYLKRCMGFPPYSEQLHWGWLHHNFHPSQTQLASPLWIGGYFTIVFNCGEFWWVTVFSHILSLSSIKDSINPSTCHFVLNPYSAPHWGLQSMGGRQHKAEGCWESLIFYTVHKHWTILLVHHRICSLLRFCQGCVDKRSFSSIRIIIPWRTDVIWHLHLVWTLQSCS
jgi:hypothetical protein